MHFLSKMGIFQCQEIVPGLVYRGVFEGSWVVNHPLRRPYLLGKGVGIGGVPLDSYDYMRHVTPPES